MELHPEDEFVLSLPSASGSANTITDGLVAERLCSGLVIRVVRTLSPASNAPMSSGRGKLDPLDNDRYGVRRWTSATDILRQAG